MAAQQITIIGGTGFIGSHLTEELIRRGHDVRAFVFYNSFGHWGWLDESPDDIKRELDIFAGDIRDPHGVRTAMKDCDVVLHLAALIGIPYSYHSPDAYVDTNIKGTLNIVQAARDLELEKIVHTSTSEVYGTALSEPMTEEHPLNPMSPYAAAKAAVHHLTRMLAVHLGGRAITVNAVAPGFFPSKMTRHLLENYREAFEKACPLGRIGEPADMAGIAVFLASRAASYINGAVIPVDGGHSLKTEA